ncbi:MAG: peptidase [Cyanobacteria bacterium RYN_339]|nr:peptidase [Cyanobacteria bacterium RYN_339]
MRAAFLAAALLLTSLPARADVPLSEPIRRLQQLLKVPSINPPGNEQACADLIAGWLREEGIEPHVYAAVPGRPCVIARLNAGAAPDPAHAIMVMGHTDVVPVEVARWSQPPFAGAIVDGKLWGRGALDMKDLVVMELEAFIQLKRDHVKLNRDVIFCAVPDEEAGGAQGARWLIANHRDEVQCEELLNEGGSGLASADGEPLMGIQVAERGTFWTRVTATGKPGHGSQDRPDSAPRKLLRALARLEAAPRHFELGPETGPMLAAMSGTQRGIKGLMLAALANPILMPLLAPTAVSKEPMLGSMLSNTVNPNVMNVGQKVNVVPAEASVEIDIRILPGHTTTETMAWLKQTLADPELRIDVLQAQEPSRSTPDGRIYRAMAAAAQAAYQGIAVAPIMTPGGATDSAFFRPLGVKCYGCAPILATAQQLASMHGDDEHITLEQMETGTGIVCDALKRAATSP